LPWVPRTLDALPGSIQPLSGSATNPAEIGFNPKGDLLIVTERATSLIDVYSVDKQGVASAPTSYASNGSTPYGFAFSPQGTLVVSEAAINALSSYLVSPSMFALISGSVSNGGGGNAPCWVAISGNGKYAYTSDAHSGTVSSYTIGRDGTLSLLTAVAAGPVGVPLLDLAFSADGRFLYGLDIGDNTIHPFRVGPDGGLTALSGVSGIPGTASGLAAR
jgi:6-phosphogluconolactonase